MYHPKIKTQKKQKKIHQSNRVTRPELIITIIEREGVFTYSCEENMNGMKRKNLSGHQHHMNHDAYMANITTSVPVLRKCEA